MVPRRVHRTPRLAGRPRPGRTGTLADPPANPAADPGADPGEPVPDEVADDVTLWSVSEPDDEWPDELHDGYRSVTVFARGDLAPELLERRAQDATAALAAAEEGLVGTVALREHQDRLVRELARCTRADVALLRGSEATGWSVVAGAGLRPLELRPLPSLPAIVGRLREPANALTVRDTDTVRGELAGMPLSRHRSLLALRFPDDLVTVVGRQEPLGQGDVETVNRAVAAALPRLRRLWRVEALLVSLVGWFDAPSDHDER